MCGIVAFLNPKANVDTEELVRHYAKQQTRGREGFGFTYVTETGKMVTKRFSNEALAFHALGKVRSHIILLHHRRPTSTENRSYQNQPIVRVTEKGWYALAHNGIISNDFQLKANEYKDYVFSTEDREEDQANKHFKKFNDSECLLHSLVDHIEEGKPILAQGSVAFVLLVGDKNGFIQSIKYGRNNNPLYHVAQPDGTEIIASECDGQAITDIATEDKLYSIDVTKKKFPLSSVALAFPTYSYPSARPRTPVHLFGERFSFIQNKYISKDEWQAERDAVIAGTTCGVGFEVRDTSKRGARSGAHTAPKARDPKTESRAEAQKDYVEMLKIVKDEIKIIEDVDLNDFSIYQLGDYLREMDTMITEVNVFSLWAYQRITGEAELIIKRIAAQRLRYLPRVTPTLRNESESGPAVPIISSLMEAGKAITNLIERAPPTEIIVHATPREIDLIANNQLQRALMGGFEGEDSGIGQGD